MNRTELENYISETFSTSGEQLFARYPSFRVFRHLEPRPLRKFCVSVFRQNQEYHVFKVHGEGLFPLSTALPAGWVGMRAGTA